MEYFTRLAQKVPYGMTVLTLKDKKTGQAYKFGIFNQNQLKGFKNNQIVKKIESAELEVEYDYETDEEVVRRSQKMLIGELQQAIDFFVEDEPLKLVDNLYY